MHYQKVFMLLKDLNDWMTEHILVLKSIRRKYESL